MKRFSGSTKRIMAMLLSGLLIVGSVPGYAFADEADAGIEEAPEAVTDESAPAEDTDIDDDYPDTVDEQAETESVSSEAAMAVSESGTWRENTQWVLEGENESNLTLTITCDGDMKKYWVDKTQYPWRDSKFYWNRKLNITKIIFNPGITGIANGAFSELTIRELTIPDGVVRIDNNAFGWCYDLEHVDLPDSVTSIGEKAFVADQSITEIDLPNNLTLIEDSTFYGCNQLAIVHIPVSVISIKSQAFDQCTGLTDVYYEGSEAQWAQLLTNVEDYNDALLSARIHCLGGLTVSLPEEDARQVFTGSEIKPVPIVTGPSGESLKKDVDYTLSYENNLNPGTAGIKVTGIGKYEDKSGETEFLIVPRKVAGLTGKTYTQREMRLQFNDLECAKGYKVRWWTVENSEDVHEFELENTRAADPKNGLLVKEDENNPGTMLAYYEAKDSLPRARNITVQVCAYANTSVDEQGKSEKIYGEYSDPVSFASGNQVIRKEMWGFVNSSDGGAIDNIMQKAVKAFGPAKARLLNYSYMDAGRCFGMCEAGMHAVLNGDRFGKDSLQEIKSIEDQQNSMGPAIGMSAWDAINYYQTLQKCQEYSGACQSHCQDLGDSCNLGIQGMYDAIVKCQKGKGEQVSIGITGYDQSGNNLKDQVSHHILALGIMYEDDQVVQIEVYDPNFNADEHPPVLNIYKSNGSLSDPDTEWSYLVNNKYMIGGKEWINSWDNYMIYTTADQTDSVLGQITSDRLTDADLFALRFESPDDIQHSFYQDNAGMLSGLKLTKYWDSAKNRVTIVLKKSTQQNLFRVPAGMKIRFGNDNANGVSNEADIVLTEDCTVKVTMDNPSYPEIQVTPASNGRIDFVNKLFNGDGIWSSRVGASISTGSEVKFTLMDQQLLFSGIEQTTLETGTGNLLPNGDINETQLDQSSTLETLAENTYSCFMQDGVPVVASSDDGGTTFDNMLYHMHAWNPWTTARKATLSEEGLSERECRLCGVKETQSIAKLTNISSAEVTGLSSKTYTGKACTQSLTVTLGGRKLVKDTDYTVSYKNNINPGTASVILTGKGSYGGNKTLTFTIGKAVQSITAKASAAKIAVGKTATVSITGNKGTKSYKSSDATIASVSSSGVVTAKKVGTVTITASAAATTYYKEASKAIKISVVPASTESVSAANLATGIKITWKKVTGAKGYKIYRGSTLIKTITSGSTVTFTDVKANTNGTKYSYKVYATASTGTGPAKGKTVYRISRPAINSLVNNTGRKMTVKWGKNAKGTGYQIQYSTSRTFATGKKTAVITKYSVVSKVIGSLTKGKTYYVRVRTYKTVGSTKFWSAWSAAKSVKITK